MKYLITYLFKFRLSTAFETGHPNDFNKKLLILMNHKIKMIQNHLNLVRLKFQDEKYNDISFDVIKRGPLLLLLIYYSFSCLIFAMEFIAYFKSR